MANSFLQLYRQSVDDPRDDYTVLRDTLGPLAQENPEILTAFPDFAEEYRGIREANAPSLGQEVVRGAKRGGLGLLSTAAGGMSLFTGDGWLRGKARELDAAAASPDLAPTIPTVEDVGAGEPSTAKRIFSRDAVRYGAAKLGEVVPSLVEAVGTGLAGAAIGSAITPGVGTVAGGVTGIAEGLVGRGIIKSAIQALVKKGASEEAIVAGLRAGTPEVLSAVTGAAKSIAAVRGGTAASALNSYILGSGDVLSEVPDNPGLAAGLGIISAIPDTILPAVVLRRLFPGVALKSAQDEAKKVVAHGATDVAKKVAIALGAPAGEAATEYFQEAINVVARNIRDDRPLTDFDEADLKRFREAAITGAVGGALVAPLVMIGGKPKVITQTDAERAAAMAPGVPVPVAAPITETDAERVAREATAAPPGAPTPATIRTSDQILAEIEAMSPEEQFARLVELRAKVVLAADEEAELQILAATVVAPKVAPTTAAVTPAPILPPAAVGTPVVSPAPAVAAVDPMPAAALLDEAYSQAPEGFIPAAPPVALDERYAATPERPADRGFPPRPSLPDRSQPGTNIFQVFADASDKWKTDVQAWIAATPENKAIIWEEASTKYGPGNVRALSRNIGNPERPWRVTTFSPSAKGYLPYGHQEYATRADAMVEEARHVDKFHDRMPGRVLDEQEIQGYKLKVDLSAGTALHWYQMPEGATADGLRMRLRGTTLMQTFVADSQDADGRVAFTEPVEARHLKALGLTAEMPSLVADSATRDVPISEITLSVDVPQFKSGSNEKGVVKPLGGTFDPTGVGPVQLWRRTDGRLELISGRHRFDLAQRSGNKTISAQIHDEASGFDKRAAARLDAELNIRDEQGSVSDYASYFKNSDLSEADAQARGLLARAKGRTGFELARSASEDLFALHQTGRISDAQAEVIITLAGPDAGLQQVGIDASLKGANAERVGDLMALAKQRVESRKASGEQGDLFGFDDTAMREMEAQAKVAQHERGELRAQISAVSGAAKKPELARKLGVDVKDPASISRKVAELRARLALLTAHPEEAGRSPAAGTPAVAPLPTNVIPIDEIPFNLTSDEVKDAPSAITVAADNAATKAEQDRQTGFNLSTDTGVITPQFQAAYHGTPHTVDEFSTDNIGTGEGAASYGWGLYFAENPSVAEGYRESLSAAYAPPMSALRKYFTPGNIIGFGTQLDRVKAFHELNDGSGRWSVEVEGVYKRQDGRTEYGRVREHMTTPSNADFERAGIKLQRGNTYTVDIADEAVAKMLDWDKPVSSQPPEVRAALRPAIEKMLAHVAASNSTYSHEGWGELAGRAHYTPPTAESMMAKTGREIYTQLAHALGAEQQFGTADDQWSGFVPSDEAASKFLSSLGIPGIKYLDQGSRDAGVGTRNFVVFDGKTARILAENGVARPVTAAELQARAEFQVAEERESAAQRLPIEAARAQEFISVVERAQAQGMRVDLLIREFFDQGTREHIERGIAALQAQLPGATEARTAAINRQIATLTDQLAIVEEGKVRGVTFSPFHIALALTDVQNADTGNLVTLIHEIAESLTMRLAPEMRGAVQRAVAGTIAEMRAKAREDAMHNRVPLARESSATDLLAEAIGQKLAAEGIPDAPSLAQAIVRWLKDLYYRIAMAAQRAFGREPSPRVALAWFENQMRRIVSGDYDYGLARMLDPYLPVPQPENVRRFSGRAGTPGGVADFFNPYTQRIEQPSVLTDSSDAFLWNLQFQQVDSEGLEIENVEARARQLSAEQNWVIEQLTPVYEAARASPDMTWEQWWRLLGVGEDPKEIIATSESRVPGSSAAKIGGERMTKYMDTEASYQARVLVENARAKASLTRAKLAEAITKESDRVVETAREVNRVEDDRRNADVHEKAMGDKLKEMVRGFIKDYSKGLKTAEQHGALAKAIRDASDLLETDTIPEEYQQVFQSVLDGKTPIWDYIREIARLELGLKDMTGAQVRRAIRDNADKNPELKKLAANKPLLVALSTLALKNAGHFDDIALGRLADQHKYAAIHEELETIRRATAPQLQELIKQTLERGKATTLRERLRDDYIERRRDLRTARERVAAAVEREGIVTKSLAAMEAVVERAQIQGSEALNEWRVSEGAEWTSMVEAADGTWSSRRRTLRFRPDGASVDSKADERALADNQKWLDTHESKKGGAQWQRVKRQTSEILMVDLQRKNHALQAFKLTKSLATIGENAKRIGGAAALQVVKMLNRFEGVRFAHSQRVNGLAQNWTHAWNAVQRSTKIKDFGILQQQVFDPVNYFLETNPGYDEPAAIRQAVKHARARLPVAPDENFNTAFSTLIRETKVISEYLLKVAEDNGLFVQDPRLKSEFRRAIQRGWLTNMRQMDGGLVRRLITDMEAAGWKLGFKEVEKTADGKKKKPEVAGAITFDDLSIAEVSTENTEALRGALKPLFTRGIVQNWLLPFINKGGTEVFHFNDNPIRQLDLQAAWARSGGDVLAWIDGLAASVDLPAPDEGNPDPLAGFRFSMLKQIDGLFGMEAKQAYNWSQTRDLFDTMGVKPHVMMDARLNDTIPSEHLDYAVYDEHTAQMLLAEIAFHSQFGRNGEALIQALAEMSDVHKVALENYNSLKGTTKEARVDEAKRRGWNYAEIESGAQQAGDVENLKTVLEYSFAVGRPGGPFDEARAGMAVMNFMVGQAIDTPKAGFYNVVSVTQRPLMMRSPGPAAIKSSFSALGRTAYGGLGSMLDALGLHLLRGSDYYKQAGVVLGGSRNQPWSSTLSYVGAGGRQDWQEWIIKPLKLVRAIQNKGARPIPMGEARDFPRFAPIPGLGVNNYISQVAGAGSVTQAVMDLEQIILTGIQYFATHREDASNPSFRFKAADVGFGRADQGVFDFWKNLSEEYGLGRLEEIVRDAIPRQLRGERLVTAEQLPKIAYMAMTEFDGTSSMNTTPTFMMENSVLRRMLPLMRWPFWQMNRVNRGFATAEGRFDAASVTRGLATMALWTLPVGLAFTFALDRYDEDVLGKKSNLPALGKVSALPLIGPIAELITSDQTVPETLKAYLVRGARGGTFYGIAADLAAQFAAPGDAGSGRRVFSMDQRVFAMSQLLNFQQAWSNVYHQDWTTTWASFWSPVIRSIGGNGFLHALDVVNNVAGLDNAQARLVMRGNASAWLRAAAEQTDIPVRRAGGSGTPTPLSVWTREMSTAAMANDRIGFAEAHRNALAAARKAITSDTAIPFMEREAEAERRVLAGWRARNPLSVLQHTPTPAQMNRLFATMNDQGRQDVREALARYAAFTTLIQSTPLQRQIDRQMRPPAPPRAFRLGSPSPFAPAR